MSGWDIFEIAIGLVLLLLILVNARDIYRYIKISLM
jgi:hypothetical protein